MAWTETHVFVDPIVDLRSESDRAGVLEAELAREIGRDHVLDGQPRAVVAEATPQDEVLVVAGRTAFLVPLTWMVALRDPLCRPRSALTALRIRAPHGVQVLTEGHGGPRHSARRGPLHRRQLESCPVTGVVVGTTESRAGRPQTRPIAA